jgi:2-methylcitrate dehydratase PrpD
MAMGLMASSGGGIRKNVGSAGKAFHIGNGVRAGLQAAVLATNGFEVDPDVIEGEPNGHGHQRFGLVESYAGAGNYSLEKMIEDLGGEFSLTRIPTMVRMHPCSTVNCVAIDGMIELATEYDLRSRDIVQVDVACHPRLLMISPYTDPVDSYRAKFCPAYAMAAALVDRKVGLAQFKDERMRDPEILSLMRRVKVWARDDIEQDQGWCNGDDNWCAVRVNIGLADGRTIARHFSQARGWPARPASWEDLRAKYEECTERTLSPLSVRKSMDMIGRLDEIESVRALVDLLRRTA